MHYGIQKCHISEHTSIRFSQIHTQQAAECYIWDAVAIQFRCTVIPTTYYIAMNCNLTLLKHARDPMSGTVLESSSRFLTQSTKNIPIRFYKYVQRRTDMIFKSYSCSERVQVHSCNPVPVRHESDIRNSFSTQFAHCICKAQREFILWMIKFQSNIVKCRIEI